MKKFIVFLVVAGVIIACNSEPATEAGEDSVASTTTTTTTTAPEEPKVDGKEVYKQYCIACHGLYGDMGASGAFNLKTSELPVEERINVITNGRNAMTPWKTILSEAQIKAVAEYTLELKEEAN